MVTIQRRVEARAAQQQSPGPELPLHMGRGAGSPERPGETTVPNGTDKPPEQHSPTAPRPNRILAEPATVEACQQDYAGAADVRQTLAVQEARQR
jgi:hypothetical protein